MHRTPAPCILSMLSFSLLSTSQPTSCWHLLLTFLTWQTPQLTKGTLSNTVNLQRSKIKEMIFNITYGHFNDAIPQGTYDFLLTFRSNHVGIHYCSTSNILHVPICVTWSSSCTSVTCGPSIIADCQPDFSPNFRCIVKGNQPPCSQVYWQIYRPTGAVSSLIERNLRTL